MGAHDITVVVNGVPRWASVEDRTSLADFLRDSILLTGTHLGCEQGVCGCCTVLLDGSPVRSCLLLAAQAEGCAVTTVEGLAGPAGELSPLQEAFLDRHALQCGFCTPGMLLCAEAWRRDPGGLDLATELGGNLCRCTGYQQILEAVRQAAGEPLGPASEVHRPTGAEPFAGRFQFLSQPRRAREHLRFVTGAGRYVADITPPRTAHVALVLSPHASARIRRVEAEAARSLSGVLAVVDGAELAAATEPLLQYLDLPGLEWRPLAGDRVRYAGEWVAAIVAHSRSAAEDAAELVEVDYQPGEAVIDPEAALADDAPLVHESVGTNRIFDRTFTWGPVDEDFAAADGSVTLRVRWNRSSTVPLETFGVVASWDPGRELLDVWASIQMPQFPEQVARALRLPSNAVRVHFDVDVGGSYGVKRGAKHAILAGYLARKLGVPVKLLEDRTENLVGGDNHGPDRIFDVSLAYRGDGTLTSLRLATLDDEGAYPGRSPLQLGKPIGAIVGPYRIGSVEYRATAVCTNKTGQVAVRGFGQAPTNYALEQAVDEVARRLGVDRLELRRRNLVRADQFPYRIPSGTEYDSGDFDAVLDAVERLAQRRGLLAERHRLRAGGDLAGVGISTCLEPSGGNALFEALLNPANDKTTFPEGCRIRIDAGGEVTVAISISSAGQGHDTLAATLVGEELGVDPSRVRVVRLDSLAGFPSMSPVASRIAIILGAAVRGAADQLRAKLRAIGAHALGVPADEVIYERGRVRGVAEPGRVVEWRDLADIAHRRSHDMPPGSQPGLEAHFVAQVPNSRGLPDGGGQVQMYPCVAFSAHLCLVRIDPATGEIRFVRYLLAHDCGTIINPGIVRGMILGGVAHGIGAALYERFAYSDDGQPLTASFMDYLLPSVAEVPEVEMIELCTPSPHTSFGQKGVGEGGYMSAPAAVASAVNDALHPLGVRIDSLPISCVDVWRALRGRRGDGSPTDRRLSEPLEVGAT